MPCLNRLFPMVEDSHTFFNFSSRELTLHPEPVTEPNSGLKLISPLGEKELQPSLDFQQPTQWGLPDSQFLLAWVTFLPLSMVS